MKKINIVLENVLSQIKIKMKEYDKLYINAHIENELMNQKDR